MFKALGDFNEASEDGLLVVSLKFALTGLASSPSPGGRVLVVDADGNRCLADVTRVEDGLMTVRLDWSTWVSPERHRVAAGYD